MPFSPDSVAITYQLRNTRTLSAVARCCDDLEGAFVGSSTGQTFVPTAFLRDVLETFTGYHRVYHDSLLAKAIETRFRLPDADSFDCVRSLTTLLRYATGGDLLDPARDCPPSTTAELMAAATDARARIETNGLMGVYQHTELPVIAPTAKMIVHGLGVQIGGLHNAIARADRDVVINRRRIDEITERDLNPSSDGDVADYLFGYLGIPVAEWTPSGRPATTKRALHRIEHLHPLPRAILCWRGANYLRQTAQTLLDNVASDGRIHANLQPLGTETGRFACDSPNLHGVPEEFRVYFVPDSPLDVLVELDFDQFELRVLANLSQDSSLVDAFHRDADCHAVTASRLLGKAEHDVTDSERKTKGKQVNFAIIYGQSAEGLALDLDIDGEQAQQLLDSYSRAFPAVAELRRVVASNALSTGYTSTLYGRRRSLQDSLSCPSRARRQAVNTLIQGSAADIAKMAIARLAAQLPPDCRLVHTIHDSVLLQAPRDRAIEIAAWAKQVMEIPPPGFFVPLRVDVGIGRTWAECKRNASRSPAPELALASCE